MPRWFLAMVLSVSGDILPAQVPVAKLSSGFGEDCLLHRPGQEVVVCMAPSLLYPGDEVEKPSGISSLKIQWFAPPATHGVRQGRTRLRVALRAPKSPARLLALAKRAFPLAERAAMEALVELRSPQDKEEEVASGVAVPLMTLLPGRKVCFGIGRLQVRDGAGALTFEGETRARDGRFTPEEMGLRWGVAYAWSLTGPVSCEGRLRLVDPQATTRIEADLATLGSDPVAAAYYLQMAHPSGEFAWLSRQFLAGQKSPLAVELREALR